MLSTLTHQVIHQAQQNNDDLENLVQNSTLLKLQKLTIDDIDVYCDITSGIVRPYLPRTLQMTALNVFHNLSHPSRRTTSKNLREKFIWFGLRKDATAWSRECLACQRAKVHRHNKTKPNHIDVPDSRFNYIYIGIIFLSKGTQFESDLFQALAQPIGANKSRTTPYHPQTNGIVKRMHRTLETALMCSSKLWTEILPTVFLGLRTSFEDDIQATPAKMLYGTCLRIPGELFVTADMPPEPQIFVEKFREHMRGIRPTPTTHHNKARIFILKDLATCSHVFIRCDHVKAPLEAPYVGLHPVITRISDFVYKVNNVNGNGKNISVDRLKLAFISKNDDTHPSELATETAVEPMQQYHWGSSIDKPKWTYIRKVTFKLLTKSNSGGSGCGGTVSAVTSPTADPQSKTP
ncbi:uncharacterized protein LOC141534082 [Cotesia typhae]|uniref:uncharacterized protein LOC141534082 n=1 Tax=Cotesia typhae TaxID=2053667 RepID=UPI003D6985F6